MRLLLVIFWIFLPCSLLAEPRGSYNQVKKIQVKNVSDLSKLAPFEDVAVIQKRYLPKTFRGELGGAFIGILNNAFFYSGGFSGRLGFFIRERFGVGVEGYYLGRIEKRVSKSLRGEPNNIGAFTDYKINYYLGSYFKWSPFYGKFGFLNNRITYFDLFFLFGAGLVGLDGGASSELSNLIKDDSRAQADQFLDLGGETTLSLLMGFGQTFALSKSLGITWDLKSFFRKKQACQLPICFSDISFSLGMNLYFPGAKYR